MNTLIGRYLVLIGLVLGTIGFFGLYPRFELSGPELLIDPAFREGFAHWQRSGRGHAQVKDGVVSLRVGEAGAGAAVRQNISDPRRYQWLSLAGELRAVAIRRGEQFWHNGRLVLVSFNADRRMISGPHVVAELEGTRSWQRFAAVFKVPGNVHSMRADIQLIGATGTLFARNLSLRAAHERADYPLYRAIGLTIWALGLAWLSWPLLARLRFDWAHGTVCLALAGIFVGVLLPLEPKQSLDTAMTGLANGVLQVLHEKIGCEQCSPWVSSSRPGHVVFFALLGFAVSWAFRQASYWQLLPGLLLLASASEVLQFFVDGRLPLVNDFLDDAVGLLIGMGVFLLLRGARRYVLRYHRHSHNL